MTRHFNLKRGKPYPLGANLSKGKIKSEHKVNFAVYSPQAKQVYLCLYDDTGETEIAKLALFPNTEHIWSGVVSGIGCGQLYGFRAEGDYLPEQGLWFNEHKLLVDPYAKDLFGDMIYSASETAIDNESCKTDNAGSMPKSKVADLPPYSSLYEHDYNHNGSNNTQALKPNIPWADTVIYECHVKGATLLNPDISDKHKGKYLGLCEPAFINKIKALGVTSLELLPIHSLISERFLVDKGLSNYWGYNTFNFFTPQRSFLVNDDVSEFGI